MTSDAEKRKKFEEIKKSYFRGSTGTTVSKGGQVYAVGRGYDKPALRVPEGQTVATSGGQPVIMEGEVLTREKLEEERKKEVARQEAEKERRRKELQKQEALMAIRELRERQGVKSRVYEGRRGATIVEEAGRRQVYGEGGKYAETPASKTAIVRTEFIKRPVYTRRDIPKQEEPVPDTYEMVREYREAPPPKSYIELGERKRDILYAKRIREGLTIGEKATLSGIGVGLSFLTTYEFAATVGKGAVSVAAESKNPIEFSVKAGARAAPFAVETVKQLPEQAIKLGVVLKEEPEVAIGFIAGEIIQAKLLGKGVEIVKEEVVKGATVLDPRYSKVTRDVLGRETIKGVKGVSGELDIDIVQPKKPRMMADLEKAPPVPLKEKPTLPEASVPQKRVIEAVKESPKGTAISGSYAQETLTTKGRGFQDIDVVTYDIEATSKVVQKKLGAEYKVVTKQITDSPMGTFEIKRVVEKRTGKIIADIDPILYAEEGLALQYKPTVVEGVPIIDPRARLGAKIKQFARGKRTEKVITDIELLTAGEVSGLRGQSVRGGFGFSFEEQAAFVGQTGDIITGQRDLFGLVARREIELERPLFASPFDIETGRAQLRKTRLGLAEPQKEATLLDILSGDYTLTGEKPQAVIFEKAKIADVPKELRGVFAKAKAGDVAAQAEFFKKFKAVQATPSGEFQAFGYPGSEAEVTLAPGEIVKRGKTIGVTLIEGKRVPIIAGEIVGASEETATLMKKAQQNIITAEESIALEKRLTAETGLEYGTEVKPRLPTEKLGVTGGLRTKEVTPRSTAPIPKTTILLSSTLPKVSGGPSPGIIFPRKTEPVSPVPSVEVKPSPKVSTAPTPSPVISQKVISPPVTTPPVSPPVVSVPPVSPPVVSPPPVSPLVTTPPSPPPPPPPPVPKVFLKRKDKIEEEEYTVEVRRRGIWEEVSIEPTPERAFFYGLGKVRTTAAASFRVTSKGPGFNTMKLGRLLPRNEFYVSKKEFGVFIEKREKRISTPGELGEITFKGLQALRYRRAKKGFNLFGG